MKGIVLAGGTGSRLHPLTTVTNKHLLPVGNYPMIFHPIARLKQAGITEILIVTGRDHMGDVMELLGSGHDFGLDFTYKVQDQAGGIAQALGLARGFCCGDSCCVILGDNVFEDDLTPAVTAFMAQESGARLLLKQVDDPERFGVAELSPDGHILGIEEKPHSRSPGTPSSVSTCTTVRFLTSSTPCSRRTVASWRSPTSITRTSVQGRAPTPCSRAGGRMPARSRPCAGRRSSLPTFISGLRRHHTNERALHLPHDRPAPRAVD